MPATIDDLLSAFFDELQQTSDAIHPLSNKPKKQGSLNLLDSSGLLSHPR